MAAVTVAFNSQTFEQKWCLARMQTEIEQRRAPAHAEQYITLHLPGGGQHRCEGVPELVALALEEGREVICKRTESNEPYVLRAATAGSYGAYLTYGAPTE